MRRETAEFPCVGYDTWNVEATGHIEQSQQGEMNSALSAVVD